MTDLENIRFYVGTIIGMEFVKGDNAFSIAKKQDYELFKKCCDRIEKELMTSKEIKELIKTKKASAEADFRNSKDPYKKLAIRGEIDAYQDLLIVIEQKEAKEAKTNEQGAAN